MRLTQHRSPYGIFGTRGLEDRSARLLAFIRKYVAQSGGIAPSFDEMVIGAGVKSKSHVSKLVRRLESEGKIRCLPNKARAMEVVIGAPQYFKVEQVDGMAVLMPLRREAA